MTPEEVKKSFEDLKSQGMDDDAILVALGKMFQNGDITKDQLGALIHQLGYEFTDEFAEKDEEESKKSVLAEAEPNENPEGNPEDEDESDDEPEDGEEEDEDESEEDEKKKAMSLFGRD